MQRKLSICRYIHTLYVYCICKLSILLRNLPLYWKMPEAQPPILPWFSEISTVVGLWQKEQLDRNFCVKNYRNLKTTKTTACAQSEETFTIKPFENVNPWTVHNSWVHYGQYLLFVTGINNHLKVFWLKITILILSVSLIF